LGGPELGNALRDFSSSSLNVMDWFKGVQARFRYSDAKVAANACLFRFGESKNRRGMAN
jgi:hypothetical protein